MSVNTIQTAAVIQSELDKAAVEQATSGWMEVNSSLVKYNGGSEVKIPELSMDGLADYDRQNGFVAGGVNFKYQTKTMTQDRGRSFSFDENAVDETNFALTAATVMGEFQRTKVIPEIDAYQLQHDRGGLHQGQDSIWRICTGGGYHSAETLLRHCNGSGNRWRIILRW